MQAAKKATEEVTAIALAAADDSTKVRVVLCVYVLREFEIGNTSDREITCCI